MTRSELRSLLLAIGCGAAVGVLIVAVLGVRALELNPPGGIGEARVWFGLYSIVWSMPTALAVEMLWPTARSRGLALAVLTNWAFIGAMFGALLIVIRRRASRSGKSRIA